MLLVDTYNLYHTSHAQHGRSIDYIKLLSYMKDMYPDLTGGRYAYVSQTKFSRTFSQLLRGYEFIVRNKTIRNFKNDSFDVELTLDAMSHILPDRIVICSSSLNLAPLVRTLSDRGCVVCVHACGVPYDMKDLCTVYELPVCTLRVSKEMIHGAC